MIFGEKINSALADLKQELTSIEGRAREVSKQLELLQREAEALKIDYLQHCLDEQRKKIARRRGFILIFRDREEMRNSLLAIAGGVILGTLITRERPTALQIGMYADDMLQKLGEARWFVSLSKEVVVAPEDSLLPGRTWVTWESLLEAMKKLKDKVLLGEKLGNLNNVIFRLNQEGLIYLGIPVGEPLPPTEQVT